MSTDKRIFVGELHALLFPEEHPAGTEFHDKDHVYWQNVPETLTERDLMDMGDLQLLLYFEARHYGNDKGVAWIVNAYWDTPNGDTPALTAGGRQLLIQKWLKDQAQEIKERQPFQWDSDTIEWVSEIVSEEFYSTSKPLT